MRNRFITAVRLFCMVAFCVSAACILILSAAAEETHTPAVINVKDFGALGDGVSDDTAAINLAVSSLRDGDTLYFPSGTYLLREHGSRSIILIQDRRDLTIRLEKDAILQMDEVPDQSTGSETRHYIFHLLNCENITLTGGRLYGDRLRYTGEALVQHGYAIRLADCRSVTVSGVEIAFMRGDGISVFSDTNGENGLRGRCYDVTVEDCHIYNCLRNGITLTSVTGCVIRNTEIHGIQGTMPQAAIDIEAEYEGSSDENVRIEDCYFYDNGSWSIATAGNVSGLELVSSVLEDRITIGPETVGVRAEDCTFGMVGVSGSDTAFTECRIDGLTLYGGEAVCDNCTFDGFRAISYRVLVTDVEGTAKGSFLNCNFYGRGLSALGGCIVFCHTPPDSLEFSDCTFRSCGLIPFLGYLKDVERDGCFFDLGWACWLCILVFSALVAFLIRRRIRKKERVCR